MREFVGRQREIAGLGRLLDAIARGDDHPGRAVSIRGRRRVGKSRMVTEFLSQSGVSSLYFAALGERSADLAAFARALNASTLDGVGRFETSSSWPAAFDLLALAVPADRPSIVVIDELPYLTREDPAFEGTLQASWDSRLSLKPVLLVLVGSDQSEMERLTSHGRPFYGRATEMRLGPLTPSDVQEVTGLGAADSIDAYLVSGGLPMILRDWPRGTSALEFAVAQSQDELSAFVVSGERSLTAEFPESIAARQVLEAIGAGERTFSKLARHSQLSEATVSSSLRALQRASLVSAEAPLSTKEARKLTRYSVSDPYLRFWLRFIGGQIDAIGAGRASGVAEAIRAGWLAWKGRAVEPTIRELLLAGRGLLPTDTFAVGGWWLRTNAVEVDIVGADRQPGTRHVTCLGSIKWREQRGFTEADFGVLAAQRGVVPGSGETTPLIAITRASGDLSAPGLTVLTAERLLER